MVTPLPCYLIALLLALTCSNAKNLPKTQVNKTTVTDATSSTQHERFSSSTLNVTFNSFQNSTFVKNQTEDESPFAGGGYEEQDVEFRLSARDLPEQSFLDGDPDPFAELTGEIDYERTETIDDERNPEWKKVFKVRYIPAKNQPINVEVRDHDPLDTDDHIGWAYFKVKDIMESSQFEVNIGAIGKEGKLIVTRVSPDGHSFSSRLSVGMSVITFCFLYALTTILAMQR